jgi:hypothetical protein
LTATRTHSLYRPQFPYSSIPDCREEQFHYFYDSTNVAALGTSIAAGASLLNIPLPLQPDAAFLWRGFKAGSSGLSIRLKDPYGNYLSPCPVPIELYGDTPNDSSGNSGGFCVPWGQGIYCPPGGNVFVDFYNPTSGALTPTAITLQGMKRFMLREPVCK